MNPRELGGHGKDSVLGTEVLIWTEFIRSHITLEEMSWPRFAASAEVGLCGEKRPGYEDFSSRLEVLFPLFAKYGIRAAGVEEWVPDEDKAAEQAAAFQMNFSEEERMEARMAQEDI